jgi:transcriptional regulator with XRE-family HTH domain
MPKKFDAEGLYSALDAQRRSRNLTWKRVAEEAGVSASTLTRMAQGRRPDVDTMAALVAWSGLDADSFVTRGPGAGGGADPLAQITAHLRSDPHLDEKGAAALEAIVKAAYERLRRG